MKKFLIGLLALSSISSFAAVDFQINCKNGFSTFQDRAARVYENKSEVITVPSLAQGQTTTKNIFKSSTHTVSINRYESQVSITLSKKVDEEISEVVGYVSYLLVDGNTVNLSLKDSDQDLNFLKCTIEKKK